MELVDSRDVAQACRLGLEAPGIGAAHCIIAAADTVMRRPSAPLMAECFPQVPVHGVLCEHQSLQSSAEARRLIGYAARHSWRNA